QDLSCAAANAQSLTRKALALGSAHQFLHQQHVVFQQNRREAEIRCACELLRYHVRRRHSALRLTEHAKAALFFRIVRIFAGYASALRAYEIHIQFQVAWGCQEK
ncbi:hypothetical protein J7413_20080, partial [Shimia sp. R10_1]|uniref:hypothetical protein n=1 Tax=Shimia sp. R10_1 TaxID=2821095 RepID=UPI001ADD208B